MGMGFEVVEKYALYRDRSTFVAFNDTLLHVSILDGLRLMMLLFHAPGYISMSITSDQ